MTAFLRPPKVPRHAGFPRGEHRGSRCLPIYKMGSVVLTCTLNSGFFSGFHREDGSVTRGGAREVLGWGGCPPLSSPGGCLPLLQVVQSTVSRLIQLPSLLAAHPSSLRSQVAPHPASAPKPAPLPTHAEDQQENVEQELDTFHSSFHRHGCLAWGRGAGGGKSDFVN